VHDDIDRNQGAAGIFDPILDLEIPSFISWAGNYQDIIAGQGGPGHTLPFHIGKTGIGSKGAEEDYLFGADEGDDALCNGLDLSAAGGG
jgi:hypothetical protein